MKRIFQEKLSSEYYQISKTGKTVKVFREDISGTYKIRDGGNCKYFIVTDSIGQIVEYELD